MTEYISREAAKEAICLTILHDGIRDALKCNIDDIPAADVVEVVRCKECKHYDCEDGDQKCVKDAEWVEEAACYYGFIEYHGPEYYCADGKRKDGGQHDV